MLRFDNLLEGVFLDPRRLALSKTREKATS